MVVVAAAAAAAAVASVAHKVTASSFDNLSHIGYQEQKRGSRLYGTSVRIAHRYKNEYWVCDVEAAS